MKTIEVNYTPIQLKSQVDMERIIEINDSVYTFNEVVSHIDLKKYFVEKDYKATGSVCGYKLPEGLLESARLEQPLFTPSTMKGGSIWRISPMNRERPFSSVRMGRPSTVVSCRSHKWACASMIV